jgi:hypothetical protein
MKKKVLVFLIIMFLVGCKPTTYHVGNPSIDEISELRNLYIKLLEENDHDANTRLPSGLISGGIIIENDSMMVENINYSSIVRKKGDGYVFEVHSCYNEKTILSCQNENVENDDYEVVSYVYLDELFLLLESLELNDLIDSISDDNDIESYDRVIIVFEFEMYDDNSHLSTDESLYLLHNTQIIDLENRKLNGLMFKLDIHYIYGNAGEKHVVVLDVDGQND